MYLRIGNVEVVAYSWKIGYGGWTAEGLPIARGIGKRYESLRVGIRADGVIKHLRRGLDSWT